MVRSLHSVVIRKPCLAIFLINFLSPLTQKTSTVLSHLVCYSLTEDKYGIVQRDIPRIIEALLSLLTALEDYQSELRAKYPEPKPEELQKLSEKEQTEKWQLVIEGARAVDVLSEVSDRECSLVRFRSLRHRHSIINRASSRVLQH